MREQAVQREYSETIKLVIGDVLVGRENVLVELGEVQCEAVQLVQHVQRAMFPRTARCGTETRRELYIGK